MERLVEVTCADGTITPVLVRGEGAPLVVLHGWGLDGVAYRAALEAFSELGFQAFAPTVNVAFGKRWSLHGLARRVDAVCDALGIGSCPVVGHSFGGVVGARLALDFPHRVTCLVTANSALVSPGAWRLTRLVLPGPHYQLAAHRSLVTAFTRAHGRRGTSAHLAGSVRWMLSGDLAPELPILAERGLPCAVLWAREACLPESVGRRSAALLGAPYHTVIPDAANAGVDHIWPLTNAAMFARRVAGVVEGLRTGAPAASSQRSSSP